MRAMTWLVTVLLLVIGAGVAVEATEQYGPPSVVTAAIDRTLGVSSLELTTSVAEPGRRPILIDSPAVYNAPNRFEEPHSNLSTLSPNIFVGSTQFVDVSSGPGKSSYLAVAIPHPDVNGINTENVLAFGNIRALRDGTNFERSSTGYTFRLSTVDTVSRKPPAGQPPLPPAVVRFLGGTVTLKGGFMRQVTIEVSIDGDRQGRTVTYFGFDAAPTIRAPARVQRCSARPRESTISHLCSALSRLST
jgi:hypothetical protein